MEDLDLELDGIENQAEQNVKVKNRFGQLSEKVILTSRERDEALAKLQAETEARSNAEKELEFHKGFSANISKYPGANEFQDQILEKFKGGYSTEDAMVSVLAKEGRLNANSPQVPQPTYHAEGGSAPTSFEGSKSIHDMSSDEKLAALSELDKTGDLANALRGR